MPIIITVSWAVSSLLIAASLYLFLFHRMATVRKLSTTNIEVDGYVVELNIKVKWAPLLKPRVYEELNVLDDENYYVLRERRSLW